MVTAKSPRSVKKHQVGFIPIEFGSQVDNMTPDQQNLLANIVCEQCYEFLRTCLNILVIEVVSLL